MGRILGGGVATDSSRQEANAIIDKGFSTAQGEGAIKAIRGLFANRYNAVIGKNTYLNNWYGKMANPLAVTTGQTGAPAPAQNFSLSAWQRANPNGDTDAAKAAAQKAGYQVVQ
jgi:hypothetical protein